MDGTLRTVPPVDAARIRVGMRSWPGFRLSVMQGGSGRHAELAEELVEWWEDLWQRGMTSRVVLVAVPPGWGRTTVL